MGGVHLQWGYFGRTRMWSSEADREMPEAANCWDNKDGSFHRNLKRMASVRDKNYLSEVFWVKWQYVNDLNDSMLMDLF